MFVQDHRFDFDAVLSATDPFALVRFGDGEMAILDGIKHMSADSWSTKGPVWIQDELTESLCADLPGFCVGLPPPCCFSTGIRLQASVRAPKSQQTFATLFMHGNLPRAYELAQSFHDPVIVNATYGTIRVPHDGVTEPWDLDAVVDQLLEVDRPILLAAGPCSNLIALRYWRRQDPSKKVSIIDVGSMLDVLHGRISRYYHGKLNDHHCSWACAPKSAKRETRKPQHVVVGRRTSVSRARSGVRVKVGRK